MKPRINDREFDNLSNLNLRNTFSDNKAFTRLAEKYKQEALEILNNKSMALTSGDLGISLVKLRKSYQAKVSVYDHNDKRVFKTFTATTKAQAKKLAYDFQQGLEKVKLDKRGSRVKYILPAPVEESHVETVSEMVRKYIDSRKVKKSTLRLYNSWLDRHIISPPASFPKLADIKINKVTSVHAEELKNAMWRLGYSKGLVNSVKSFLSSTFKYAMSLEKLDRNVFDLIDYIERGDTEPPETLQESEVKELLDVCKGQDYELYFNVLVRTWVRRGECRGLKWENIDFDNHNIYIRQQVYNDEITTLKTASARRTIELPKESPLFTLLKHEKERQQLLLKDSFSEQRLVFSRGDGKPWAEGYWRNRLRKLRSKLSFKKKWAFHTLRHTGLTLNIADGQEIGKVSRMAGHSKTSMTLDVYAHAIPGEARGVTESYENKLDGTGGIR